MAKFHSDNKFLLFLSCLMYEFLDYIPLFIHD